MIHPTSKFTSYCGSRRGGVVPKIVTMCTSSKCNPCANITTNLCGCVILSLKTMNFVNIRIICFACEHLLQVLNLCECVQVRDHQTVPSKNIYAEEKYPWVLHKTATLISIMPKHAEFKCFIT